MKVAISACLLGERCRYDGASKPNAEVIEFASKHEVIPICPERAAGLEIPRVPSEMQADKPWPCVKNASGDELTEAFVQGALKTKRLLEAHRCHHVILKSKSPSCGVGEVYDGTFSGRLIKGNGITAQLLIDSGYKVAKENTFAEVFE